jgi:type I restriction enzyme M protein
VLDGTGKELERRVLMPGDEPPPIPDDRTGRAKVRVLPISRIFRNQDFGYRNITVERPQRDESGEIVLGHKGKQKGKPQPDSKLRDTETVPLTEDVGAYFAREVLPHAPDAWIDDSKTRIGYEIPFNRHFYVFEPPRPLDAIDADLARVTDRIKVRIEELSARALRGIRPTSIPGWSGWGRCRRGGISGTSGISPR